MEHEFKRVLSGKIIVEGKKSLDFLQGLLVYIAWYPVHTNPKNNQSFMYMNLAISLVTDLGLDRETPNPSAFSDFDLTGLYTKEGGYSIAAKQAYLGTYYLSSANLMDDHGRALLRSSPSCDFFALVQLQHLRERIAKIHLSKTPAADYKMEAINAEMNIQIFLNELQDWSESVSEDIRNLRKPIPFIL
ncbi:hypothetical protein M7I_4256 [Glarea lozoyensis 74030]|uniref:Uncharacterized protein n=1 Tax=Glarea lozoyensis (strain ATCC 74030 / MF5533) TaxID=1104152 RepID=H0ENP5_GLAL7|nr:hypothetical protein M7I_4256 [Glarea lozoyensis 74030]